MTLLIGSLQLGLMYGLLALGIYITFRILGLPDLTADGSFTLGLSVSAALTVAGQPYLGLAAAMLAGALAGAVTGLLQTKLGIQPILAGILTMSGLYSINLLVLGSRSNLSLIGASTIFSDARSLVPALDREFPRTAVTLLAAAVIAAALIWFFQTHFGLCIRATGNNADMVRASSINTDGTTIAALAAANACVALSGAVIAQYQGFADISSGIGTVVVGLVSVIIGEALFGRRSVTIGFLSAIAGSIIYRLIIALALEIEGFPAFALKLVSAVIVVIALSIPNVKKRFETARLKKEAMRDV